MLKNQRPYQYLLYKTNCKWLSVVLAFGSKVFGLVLAAVLFVFKKQTLSEESEENLYKRANEIYKKPVCDEEVLPLPSLEKSIDVSVIIPAYNAEKYIKQCIDSVLGQKTDYKIQIIVVNDNSTDNTKSIVKSFGEKVCFVENFAGGTAASTRNKGLEYAKGKYIMFLDSDDILLEDAINMLIDYAYKYDSDIVQGGWKYLFDDNSFGPVQNYVETIYTDKKRKDIFDLPGMPWGKVYKRELFENIRFPSKFNCFEDTIIHFLVYRTANKISAINKTVYGWRKNNNGITATSQNNFKAMQAYWIAEEMIKRNDELNLEKDELFNKCITMQLTNFCYDCISGCNDEMQELVFKLCVNLYKKLPGVNTKNFNFAQKLGYKSLVKENFGLWKVQGKLFQLIN